MINPRIKKLGAFNDLDFLKRTKITVWLVDGRKIRDNVYIDFVEGGNGERYDFIPKDEVWIEDGMKEDERSFVLVHEFRERELMKKNWSYDDAHSAANQMEISCRDDDKFLKDMLDSMKWNPITVEDRTEERLEKVFEENKNE